MHLFERFLIRRGEGSDAEYLPECNTGFSLLPFKRGLTKYLSEAWSDSDIRLAFALLEMIEYRGIVGKWSIVQRWWWFGWHEAILDVGR